MLDNIKDLLLFRRMLIPVIIRTFFWLAALLIIIVAVWAMFRQGFWSGLLILVLGPLSIRIVAEMIILLFRINETLTEIRNTLVGKS